MLSELGPPPLWKRPATLATLVRIILEQQVSLASAKATFDRLVLACDGKVTHHAILEMGQQQLAALGFSRQKARYTHTLAQQVDRGNFKIGGLSRKSDEDVRAAITDQLGMGNWTADVFLMMALLRSDLFPTGDLALVKGLEELEGKSYATADSLLARAEHWRPYRSVATRMIWQSYLHKRSKVIP
ncbi:DNA-3-methyladenine glycosylase [Rubripirellula obstinata]|uniref:DNA-3-methyladenine glycosylase II n=1 Tax=Rubripirellula obstinata TaxID=406547 RepID=A0A5B1CEA2_9BACT|nr:DNA-3-methyladenine glycosylase [Rubripirellula obstinata]